MSEVDIQNIYPSIKDLIPDRLMNELPHSLVTNIAQRYQDLGGKYMIDAFHTDGRQINNVINCNNALSTQEELVDAVFNLLAWMFVEYGVVNVENASEEMAAALQATVMAYVLVSNLMIEQS